MVRWASDSRYSRTWGPLAKLNFSGGRVTSILIMNPSPMALTHATPATSNTSLPLRRRSPSPSLFSLPPVGLSLSRSRPLLLPCLALETFVQSGGARGDMEKESKLWGGRFEEGVHESVERFTESVSFEAEELWMHDIRGSMAHANMLAAQVLFLSGCRNFSALGNCCG